MVRKPHCDEILTDYTGNVISVINPQADFKVMLCEKLFESGSLLQRYTRRGSAGETYQKGLKRMIEVNQKAEGKLIHDVITSYMIVGDYYRRVNNVETAKVHYQFAMKQASELYAETKNPMYENIMNRLKPFL